MADSVGGTPLEAAARGLAALEEFDWDKLNDVNREYYTSRARAALTAAIDALPPERIADLRYEMENWGGVGALRRALGLEGDRG